MLTPSTFPTFFFWVLCFSLVWFGPMRNFLSEPISCLAIMILMPRALLELEVPGVMFHVGW